MKKQRTKRWLGKERENIININEQRFLNLSKGNELPIINTIIKYKEIINLQKKCHYKKWHQLLTSNWLITS